MSERRSGRKRHMAEGQVSQVRRSQRGLGTHRRVGESTGFMTAFRRLLKGSRDEKEEE